MTDKTPADWLTEIKRLEGQLQEAKESLVAAQDKASDAILRDDLNGEESQRITVARDWIVAVEAALVKARQGLKDTMDREKEAARQEALKMALEAAKKRHIAVKNFEKAMASAEHEFGEFISHGMDYRKHVQAAGMKAPSIEKLAAPEVLRGSLHLLAPKLSNIAHVPRAVKSAQVLLSDWVAQQTPWKG